ncbi:recombinase family protein, partial [Paenibacillus odorifer]|uniref:recombinase family protein n=1 Tax=Paenibacillus odorifer TaxID=189426 RepID=UPI0020C9C844
EKGKSVKTDDRPEFQKMIALAKRSNRPFDAVIVHKFDRFSRKRDDHVIYKALLNQCGVKVIRLRRKRKGRHRRICCWRECLKSSLNSSMPILL